MRIKYNSLYVTIEPIQALNAKNVLTQSKQSHTQKLRNYTKWHLRGYRSFCTRPKMENVKSVSEEVEARRDKEILSMLFRRAIAKK